MAPCFLVSCKYNIYVAKGTGHDLRVPQDPGGNGVGVGLWSRSAVFPPSRRVSRLLPAASSHSHL